MRCARNFQAKQLDHEISSSVENLLLTSCFRSFSLLQSQFQKTGSITASKQLQWRKYNDCYFSSQNTIKCGHAHLTSELLDVMHQQNAQNIMWIPDFWFPVCSAVFLRYFSAEKIESCPLLLFSHFFETTWSTSSVHLMKWDVSSGRRYTGIDADIIRMLVTLCCWRYFVTPRTECSTCSSFLSWIL